MRVNRDTAGWRSPWPGDWYSPDGTRYTVCRNGERPDVALGSSKHPTLPPIKLRLWDTSGAARRVKRAERAAARASKRVSAKKRPRRATTKGIRRTGG